MARRIALLVAVLILAGSAALQVAAPPIAVDARDAVFDMFQRMAPRPYPADPVRIVDIDDESLARIGQWPWPRARVAELVERLADAGAGVVGFDVMFAERDGTAPAVLLERWRDEPAVRDLLQREPDPDASLAAAIGRLPVVTGFALTNRPSEGRRPAAKAAIAVEGADPSPFAPRFSGAVASLPLLERAAAGNGSLNALLDRDGVVRAVPLIVALGDRFYPSLAAEMLRVARGNTGFTIATSTAGRESWLGGRTGITAVHVGRREIRTDPRGALRLHYTAPQADRYVPAWRVLAGEVAEPSLKGRMLVVGASAKGLQDIFFSPLGVLTPGVENHAQAIEQMRDDSYLLRPDWSVAAEVLLLLAVSALVMLSVAWLSPVKAAVAALGGMAAAWLAAWLAFVEHRLLLDPLLPSLAVVLVYIAVSFGRHLDVERERARIRTAFSAYVSPNRVRYLLDHPEDLQLGGERRECSFVMTDLEGFTGLIERSPPEALTRLLNDYLEGMIEIAFRHEGTLDRIVGDAVAVMFSAPVTQPDHKRRAVACALEMNGFASAFAARQRAQGMALGSTRIGVHSGIVTVGNFGGKAIMDYRALGDAINTAARLETVNKQIGTVVCVSAATADGSPGFRGRPVGTLVLKGKTEGVLAYEPLTAEREATFEAYLAAYALLEQESPDAMTAFTALMEQDPSDPLAVFHLERLRQGEIGATIVFEAK